MSAITGIFYRNGREVGHNQIKKMNDSLSHRGKDGSGVWSDGSVALGHQMLHTTQESLHERLPFKDENSGMVITADARIDNRAELAPILKLEDNENVPDSAFILEAYKMWGENCPEKLLGDFAFAVWDPEKEQLFCARDHMGVKPFCYYLSDEAFFFATEIKALFCLPYVPQELNELKVAFYLISIDDKISTFYKNVFRLSPAHSITVSSHGSKLRKYWELDPNLKVKMDSEEDYIEAFHEIFAKAIDCRLRSVFPVGFELSGGLDSSSIMSVAKILENNRNSHNKLSTFSFIFEDFPDADESYYIKKIIDKGGIEPHFVHAGSISPLEQVKNILWSGDGPFSSQNESVMWNLYKKMHENNIRVVFTGENGDSVISKGKNYFRELTVTFQWKKLFKEIRSTSSHFKKNKRVYKQSESVFIKTVFNKSFFNILVKQVIFPLIPEFLKNKGFRQFYNKKNNIRFKPDLLLLNKKFKKRLKLERYLDELYNNSKRQCKTPKEDHHNIINSYNQQKILEIIDSRAAAFSIEPRHPFFDKRVVEFCYAIPTEMKYKFGWDRFILRKAMDGILPEEVQWRFFKQDLSPPLQKNLFLEKKFIDKTFHDNKRLIEDYVDMHRLNIIYKKYKSKVEEGGIADTIISFADITDIWLVTILCLWMRETNLKFESNEK